MADPDPERASRQELVVRPQHSNLPLILGACVCGCLGFGIVWGLGIGRVRPAGEEPAVFVPADSETAGVPPVDGWRRPATDPDEQPETDRYPDRPVSYERPVQLTGGESRSLSRFSAPPPAEEPVESAAPTSFRDDGPRDDDARVQPSPAELTAEDPQPLAAVVPAVDGPLPNADEEAESPSAVPPPMAARDAGETLPAASDPVAAPAFRENTDLAPPEAAVATDDDVAPGATPVNDSPAAAASPASPMPSTDQPPARVADPFARPAAPSMPPVAAVAPVAVAPAAAPSAFAAAAAAVPVPVPGLPPAASPVGFGPQALAGVSPSRPPMDHPLAPAGLPPSGMQPSPTGDGRPGPAQLEGVQAPQITVEKRGPREVQVGKPARYEISIRNVGTATARDVMLHDAVPAGTRLMATTPPAAPDTASSGGLVWMLGTLEPGAGTKVAMEVMPEAEGEIGSVASVSFRADATIRSRSTKPGLSVEGATPAPVLIGGEITASLVVSNPGTGVSTGIVLVGTLPEGVSHPAGRELEFDVGRLEPGERRTIDLKLATTSPGVHAMTIMARADGQLHAEAAVPLEVTAPMLELAADMPGRRYLQRPASCLITMHNTGTAPAQAVELATQLPPGMKFVRANNAGFYDERHHRVLWSLEELPAGETGTVELVVMPVDLGPQKLVTAARNPAGLSDQIANTIDVEGLASLSFLISDSEDPIEVGGMSEYVIRVGNQGTKPASGVRVSATLLGDLEPVEAKGPVGHRIENLTVFFEPLAKLVPAEEATYKIRIRGRRAGDHRVQVQVTSDEHTAPITKEEVTRVYADR